MMQFQSVGEIIAVIKRRFWLMAAIIAVGCVLAIYSAMNSEKTYEAIAAIQIEAPQVTNVGLRNSEAAQQVKRVEQRIMSRDNLAGILEKHNLFNEEPASIVERVGQLRDSIRLEQILTTAEAWMPGAAPSGLLIYVQLGEPEKARDVANDLMFGVIEAAQERSRRQARAALDLFEEEEQRVVADIDELEEQIARYKTANSQYLTEGLAVLRSELGELRTALLGVDQDLVALLNNPARQREDVVAQQRVLLEDRRSVINQRISQIEQIIEDAPGVTRDLNLLERELARRQDQFSVVTRRKAEAEVGQLLEEREQGSRFEVLETALAPEYPVSRSRKTIAFIGGLASVMLAMGVAFVLELLNNSIRSPAQMDRTLGMTPVVSIPVVRTNREQRFRRNAVVAGVVALVVAIPLALRQFADVLPFIKSGSSS